MELHPFKALRPAPGKAAAVACPPYDVMSKSEARAIGQSQPDSFIHVIRPDADLPDDVGPYTQQVYDQAARGLAALRERGVLVEDPIEAIWLYRQQMGEHVQIGFVGCANVEDYASGHIKRHEFTRKAKEDDRTRHVDATCANAGPVFLTLRHVDGLEAFQARAMSGEPELEVRGEHAVLHQCWAIREPAKLAELKVLLAQSDAFYIADGHHRAASAERVRDLRRAHLPRAPKDITWERFLVVVFPAEQLRILPYNRVVHDLAGHSSTEFLEALSAHFSIQTTSQPSPANRHEIGLYLDQTWHRLTLRPHVVDETDPVARLDVALLQNLVLGPLLGIHDPRVDDRVEFIGGIRGTDELERRVNSTPGAAAFSMFPTAIHELLDVADSGEVMPPKSTWFEPKLASGLLVHDLGPRDTHD